jgi:SOS-response transcriptional repressor LexA
VELQPANPRFKPLVLDPDEVQILGKVIELRREWP